MTDLFYEGHADGWINKVWAVMALCPPHTFIVLTKRPERMREYISLEDTNLDIHEILSFEASEKWGCHKEVEALGGKYFSGQYGEFGMCELPPVYEDVEFDWPLKNAWLGVSVEDQKAADERIPVLLETPAAVRFLSVEPLLGAIKLGSFLWDGRSDCRESVLDHLNWVIVGGESGQKANPMHPDWARQLRDQCKAAGVPFFFKQHGSWLPWEPDDAPFWKSQAGGYQDGHTLFPEDMDTNSKWADGLDFVLDGQDHVVFQRVGKKAAGRLLDGVEHNEWPEVKP